MKSQLQAALILLGFTVLDRYKTLFFALRLPTKDAPQFSLTLSRTVDIFWEESKLFSMTEKYTSIAMVSAQLDCEKLRSSTSDGDILECSKRVHPARMMPNAIRAATCTLN